MSARTNTSLLERFEQLSVFRTCCGFRLVRCKYLNSPKSPKGSPKFAANIARLYISFRVLAESLPDLVPGFHLDT
jgi:hypothetical protein